MIAALSGSMMLLDLPKPAFDVEIELRGQRGREVRAEVELLPPDAGATCCWSPACAANHRRSGCPAPASGSGRTRCRVIALAKNRTAVRSARDVHAEQAAAAEVDEGVGRDPRECCSCVRLSEMQVAPSAVENAGVCITESWQRICFVGAAGVWPKFAYCAWYGLRSSIVRDLGRIRSTSRCRTDPSSS